MKPIPEEPIHVVVKSYPVSPYGDREITNLEVLTQVFQEMNQVDCAAALAYLNCKFGKNAWDHLAAVKRDES